VMLCASASAALRNFKQDFKRPGIFGYQSHLRR
jgi:hypothetical protein